MITPREQTARLLRAGAAVMASALVLGFVLLLVGYWTNVSLPYWAHLTH